MDESTFAEKYINSTGELPRQDLQDFLVDAARLAGKAKLLADAADIAAALHDEGLDSWDDLENITVEYLREAGMRKIDACYVMRKLSDLREWAENEEDQCRGSVFSEAGY